MNEIQIGTVKKTVAGKVISAPVMCSFTYGITCSKLGTTNGYIHVVAKLLQLMSQYTDGSLFELELQGKPWDFSLGESALNEELKQLWLSTKPA